MAGGAPLCLVVGVGGERFGLDMRRVRTVIEYRPTTPIPGRPEPFVGALNHYGELLPVAPLAVLLDREVRIDPVHAVIAVLDWEGAALGLLVERAHGIVATGAEAREVQVLGRWSGPFLDRSLQVEGAALHVLDLTALFADLAERL